jgi:hypothetical protein
MAYDVFMPDTSTRNKLLGTANQFATSDADIMRYLAMIRSQGQQGLQQAFGAAQADIGAQFQPTMRMATARLGANPLLGDSGYANRLNRQIQGAAFGDLSRAYGNAAAQQGQTELSALQNLINQRLGERSGYLQAMLGSAQKKKNTGDYLGQFGGAALGAALA